MDNDQQSTNISQSYAKSLERDLASALENVASLKKKLMSRGEGRHFDKVEDNDSLEHDALATSLKTRGSQLGLINRSKKYMRSILGGIVHDEPISILDFLGEENNNGAFRRGETKQGAKRRASNAIFSYKNSARSYFVQDAHSP